MAALECVQPDRHIHERMPVRQKHLQEWRQADILERRKQKKKRCTDGGKESLHLPGSI